MCHKVVFRCWVCKGNNFLKFGFGGEVDFGTGFGARISFGSSFNDNVDFDSGTNLLYYKGFTRIDLHLNSCVLAISASSCSQS
jgi:hypothetical protein